MTDKEKLKKMGFNIGTKFKNQHEDISIVLEYQEKWDNFGVVFIDDANSLQWYTSEQVLSALKNNYITIIESAPILENCKPTETLSHKEIYPHTCEYCGSDCYYGGMSNIDCSNSKCISKIL